MNKKAELLMMMGLLSLQNKETTRHIAELSTPHDRVCYPYPSEKVRYTPIEPPKTRRTKYKKKKNRAGK